MASELPSLTLFYRQGTSDKVYRLAIEAQGDRFTVNFGYGRRGAALRAGTKTPSPVPLDLARRIYDEIVADKIHEGYQPEAGAADLGLMQTKAGRAVGFESASALQEELWSRSYGHSWGTRDEFASLLSEHPEVLEMEVKAAADVLLANLTAWSPTLAAKEAKAKRAYVSPEQAKKTEELIERLKRAIRTKIPVGPDAAKVFVCDFDPELEPKMKPGTWEVMSGDHFAGEFDSQEKALARAKELADRACTFETSLTDDGRSFTLEIRAKKIVP